MAVTVPIAAGLYLINSGDTKEGIKKRDGLKIDADKGDKEAQHKLGDMYYYGSGIKKDYDKALKWYTMSSEQNYPIAHFNLANMYYLGNGVDKDFDKAFALYTKAGNQDEKYSQHMLGALYSEDSRIKDYGLSISWYIRAINNGNLKSKCNIVFPLLESDNSLGTKKLAAKYINDVKDKIDYSYCTTLWNKYELNKVN